MSEDRIRELENKITELKERIPPHDAPPHLLIELEELEEELEKLQKG